MRVAYQFIFEGQPKPFLNLIDCCARIHGDAIAQVGVDILREYKRIVVSGLRHQAKHVWRE